MNESEDKNKERERKKKNMIETYMKTATIFPSKQ